MAAQIFSLDFTLDQAGVVYFVTDFAAVTAFVNGDRSFGRFGNVVKVITILSKPSIGNNYFFVTILEVKIIPRMFKNH